MITLEVIQNDWADLAQAVGERDKITASLMEHHLRPITLNGNALVCETNGDWVLSKINDAGRAVIQHIVSKQLNSPIFVSIELSTEAKLKNTIASMEKQMWSLQKQVDLFDEMKMQAEKDGSVVLVGGKFKYSCQLTGLVNDALAGEYFDTDLRHFHGASFLAYYEYTRGLGYWNGKETVKAHPSIKLIDDVLTAVWGTNSLAEIAEMSPLESSAIQDNQLRAGITDDERDLTPEYIALMQTFVSDGDFMSRCSNVRAEQWLRENQGDFAYEHFDYLEEYLDKHVSLNDRFRIAWQPNPSAISVFSFVIGRIGMRLNFVLPDYDFILLDKAHYAEYERLALARDNYLANPKKFFYTR